MKKTSIYLLVLLMSLLLVACGGGEEATDTADDSASSGATIDVVMNDIFFGDSNDNATNPPTWTVPANAPVTVNMDNQGVLEHTWVVVKQGETLPDVVDPTSIDGITEYVSDAVLGGETVSASFRTPSEAGEYLVICSIAGHYPTMQGKLVVE